MLTRKMTAHTDCCKVKPTRFNVSSVTVLKMVSEIVLIACFSVCVASGSAQSFLRSDKKFDDVQAAVFTREAYPDLGDIPVLNRKVFRGTRVQIEEHPYVVSIRRLHAHYAVGAILSFHTIVTVAHPVYNVPITELGVVAGETYCDRGAAYTTVLLALFHQDFDPYTLRADLAILRIYEAIFRKSNQKPIVLFNKFQDIKPNYSTIQHAQKQVAQTAFVTGWGRCDWMGNELCLPRSSIYFPDEKQDPMLRTISFNHSYFQESPYCVGYEKHKIKLVSGKGMLCLGSAREMEPLAPCLAAPGAPLTVLGELVGLQSWGFGCGYTHDLPLIYTDLRYYDSWLKSNLEILDTLNMDSVSELYMATKAYFMQDWLAQTSDQQPVKFDSRDMTLQTADIDRRLAVLTGNVTDFRDYAGGGALREQKAELYAILRAESEKKQQLQEISKDVLAKMEPLRSFLDQQFYGLINNSNTEVKGMM